VRAAERHVPAGRRQVLLLSGGRDSRLLAGSLKRSRREFGTITLGQEGDLEARCARAVADALGVSNRVVDVPLERYAELAELHVRAEGLVGHLAGVHNWGMGEVLGREAESVTTGHMLGNVSGGVGLDWARAPRSGELSEAALWETMARHALPRATLDRLVRDRRLREALGEVDARMRARFQESAERLEDRARLHVQTHWARYHPGAVPWRLSFFGWPSVPALDTELLAAAAPLAASYSGRRVLQDAILRRRHGRLARLPLVRASGSLEPVAPGARWRAAGAARRLGERLGVRKPESFDERRARDRYSRIYDLDNPGWVAIRRRAEPGRPELLDLFHEDALAELLPGPDRPMHQAQPVTESYGRKCLIALMLLARGE
jgi:asparagine synthase (glutamine-hydrolysing)